jgi:hypothetical protein
MPRKAGRDMTKEQHWRGVINLWHSSGLTGAEFCRRHGHQYCNFQEWRRIIRKRDAESAAKQRPVSGSTNNNRSRARSHRTPAPAFVQATLTDSVRAGTVASDDSKVEVVLACGTVLRITTTCPPQFLSAVVAALESR